MVKGRVKGRFAAREGRGSRWLAAATCAAKVMAMMTTLPHEMVTHLIDKVTPEARCHVRCRLQSAGWSLLCASANVCKTGVQGSCEPRAADVAGCLVWCLKLKGVYVGQVCTTVQRALCYHVEAQVYVAGAQLSCPALRTEQAMLPSLQSLPHRLCLLLLLVWLIVMPLPRSGKGLASAFADRFRAACRSDAPTEIARAHYRSGKAWHIAISDLTLLYH